MDTVRIGLIRHFKVQKDMPHGWMTAGYLVDWLREYNTTDVIVSPVDLGERPWAQCFSSDLKRAHVTAQAIYPGPIVAMPQLREADVLPFNTGNLKLPYWMWRLMLRLAWATSHKSQQATRDDFLQRMLEAAEMLASQEKDTLVVCHAGMMYFLRKELLKRGFTGPKFKMAENARLYVFEKKCRPSQA